MKYVLAAIPSSLALMACAPTPAIGSKAVDARPGTGADADSGASSSGLAVAQVPDARTPETAASQSKAPGSDAAPGDQAVNDSIDTMLGEHEKYRAVIIELQKSVVERDANAVAALVNYPIRVKLGGKDVVLKDQQAFIARYADVMTPDIAKTIVSNRYSGLLVNAKDVMFDSGQARDQRYLQG